MIPPGYHRARSAIPRQAGLAQRIDSAAARNTGSLAASAGGRAAEINPDTVDFEAASMAAQEAQKEAERDLAAAREGGDLVAIGIAMRRVAEAIFYQLGLAGRIPVAYEEAYKKAAEKRERADDPKYAEYIQMKSIYEGNPASGTVPKPQD